MENKISPNDNIKNALCYIPLAAFFLHFAEENKNDVLEKHIKYGMIIFIAYCVISVFLSWILFGFGHLAYIGVSVYMGYKAYSGVNVNIKFIDDFLNNSNNKKSL